MAERTTRTGPADAEPASAPEAGSLGPEEAVPGGMACDFCGDVVPLVRRVALDADYERLRTPHRELYACPACSEDKERRRLGLAHR